MRGEEPKPGHNSRIERISVVSPMRNEADHIEGLIADIATQDVEGQVEVLIADGRSTDDSVQRATEAAARHDVSLTILDNPSRWVPQGVNACIRRARGDLLVRLDCHSRYPPDYLRRCVAASEETGAEVVGGIIVARGRTWHERAVACAMDGPFGGVDWMRDAAGDTRRETDIAVYGAFKPEAFELAGLFDESFRRNEDEEFTLRLRERGGRVLLDSSIHVYYTPRGSFRGVFRQYHDYGLWKPTVMLSHRRVLSVRSLVPPAFVLSLSLLGLTARRSPPARRLLLAELGVYGTCSLGFAVASVRRRREPCRLVARTAAVFPTFHIAYGAGMLHGALRIALARVTGRGGLSEA
jgi:succinoglycan biosynthesis protein ExoA